MRQDIEALKKRKCVPCMEGTPAMTAEEASSLTNQLRGWELKEGKKIRKHISFPDFRSAWKFLDRVAEIAEEEDHHPDLHLSWGKLEIELWTHKAGGLTENDFILAAKIDGIAKQQAHKH